MLQQLLLAGMRYVRSVCRTDFDGLPIGYACNDDSSVVLNTKGFEVWHWHLRPCIELIGHQAPSTVAVVRRCKVEPRGEGLCPALQTGIKCSSVWHNTCVASKLMAVLI